MKIRIRKGLNNILISLGVISLLGNSRKVMGQTFYQCMPCKAGYYSDGSGGGCKICPRGTYSAHSISEKCTTCPEGQYTDSEGSTSCKACPKGHYCTGGHKYECLEGYYQPNEGANTCGPCRDDNYYVQEIYRCGKDDDGSDEKVYLGVSDIIHKKYFNCNYSYCSECVSMYGYGSGKTCTEYKTVAHKVRCCKNYNKGCFAISGDTFYYNCDRVTGATYYTDKNGRYLGEGDG